MSDDIGALQEESGKAIISRAFDTLNRHWLPFTNRQMSEFIEATRNAVIESGMMLRLYPHVLDLVSIQFGRPLQDVSTNDAVYQYSFKQRWPSEYSQIIANDKDGNTEARENIPPQSFFELLQEVILVGCAFRLMHIHDILASKYHEPNALVSNNVRRDWFEYAYAADIALEQWAKGHPNPTPESVITRFIDSEIVPFYKARRVGGFMGRNYGKFEGHARMLFYAGVLLAIKHLAQLEETQ